MTGAESPELDRAGESARAVVAAIMDSSTSAAAVLNDREISCLRPEDDKPQTRTRWRVALQGELERNTDLAALEAELRSHFDGEGWEPAQPPPAEGFGRPAGSVLFVGYAGRGQSVQVDVVERDGQLLLVADSSTDCFEHGEDHRMTRSKADPGYGKGSTIYDYRNEE
ncbi:hypothetical protein [Arthrobacter mangrovi]|uniref:hypothetical protein n=1 Tax=Arthrobacter mangrovi TaxID=2966350 RepID=UPI0022317EAE|nr:hypothetical protein [Arthrobacter mangrovi]